jgi:hypothetical protein
MLQALNKLLFTPGDETKIVMLNGNKNEEDILMRKQVHTSLGSSSPASFSC